MNHISMSERVYLDLRERILLKVYLPGHHLTSGHLANEFNCSAVTVARVLRTLSSEGYLVDGARATGLVRHWTKNELWDAIDMRAVILAFAADCCARRTNQLALRRLKSLSDVLETLATTTRRLDAIADCIALFETELCMGTGIEGLPVALRNAFPPALVRKSVLIADDESLNRRFQNLKSLVGLIGNGHIGPDEAVAHLGLDDIDAALLQDKYPEDLKDRYQEGNIVPFRSRETTYYKWATDAERVPSTVST